MKPRAHSHTAQLPRSRPAEPLWIEIFADRIAEDLKQVLQEDMDWMTSHPILERLNRLREAEASRQESHELRSDFRKAS